LEINIIDTGLDECGFWIADCGIEGFAIWDVRFRTEDAGF